MTAKGERCGRPSRRSARMTEATGVKTRRDPPPPASTLLGGARLRAGSGVSRSFRDVDRDRCAPDTAITGAVEDLVVSRR